MNRTLANTFFHLIRELLQDHSSQWQKSLPELSKQQYSILATVSETPGIEQVELMEAAISSKAALAELLSRMEGKGLLKREAGEQDKRRRFIYLTPAGQALFEASRPIADAIDNRYLERVNKEQYESALFVLQTMVGKK
ncbi:homoprotocatechuate degradation operon regulator%2C HpaR [Serratia marcescens]|uniref:MarR family winged helix-turn-helix transcriptional regulator n=1 Tax=Serratia marcescens TaxID=615 RepID=UPI0007452F36|nr:MarR family transcriptional regulator [Serratia marcescens]CVH06659.1 homoprotocatechuate degradation operon regulator%2C HpaR [Serratia marcescens]